MPETSPAPPPTLRQIEDLTRALLHLGPTLQALEATLRGLDRAAAEKQDQMARSLDRVANALETLSDGQASLMAELTSGRETAHRLSQAVTRLDHHLAQDASRTMRLGTHISDLLSLLRGPA